MAKITIYTDREILALGLAQAVASKHYVEAACLECLSSTTPLLTVGGCPPDAVILDAAPEVTQMVERLRSENCAVPLAIWERVEATEPALNALLLGVQGVLLDTSSPSDVLACLETILSGGIWVPPAVAKAAIVSRQCHLTKREGELMNLIANGLANKEMAYRLGIGVGTVKVYLSRLFRKLGVADRYELALLALRHGGGATGEATLPGGAKPACQRSVFVPRRAGDQWQYGNPAR